MRAEFIVETEEEFNELKNAIEDYSGELKLDFIDVYCSYEQKTHFFSRQKNPVFKNKYTYKEDC